MDYIHAKGLKAGIYSAPGTGTCQGLAASYQHEEQDARTWAKWGFDYVKYDWCRYPEPADTNSPLELLQKPVHPDARRSSTGSIATSSSRCASTGWGKVWEWGDQVGGNLWRVTGDITDTWPSMSAIGFQQTGHEKFAGPGTGTTPTCWSSGTSAGDRIDPPRPTNLTPNEQLTHISLWALQAAPLLIGADMTQMDEWTVNLLGNREVLAINQDPLGKAAGRVWADNWTQIWARPLEDGTMAVGLFNRASGGDAVTMKFADLGLPDMSPIRFPWTQSDLAGVAGNGKQVHGNRAAARCRVDESGTAGKEALGFPDSDDGFRRLGRRPWRRALSRRWGRRRWRVRRRGRIPVVAHVVGDRQYRLAVGERSRDDDDTVQQVRPPFGRQCRVRRDAPCDVLVDSLDVVHEGTVAQRDASLVRVDLVARVDALHGHRQAELDDVAGLPRALDRGVAVAIGGVTARAVHCDGRDAVGRPAWTCRGC